MQLNAQLVLTLFIGLQMALLVFKRRASHWHYHSDKPFAWNELRKGRELSPALLRLEQASDDKLRLYTFWLQVERLRREAIPGAFAELGVYKGETAEWLHTLDPERPLHLLDTFEGFNHKDLALEKAFGKQYRPGFFADTDLKTVQKRLGDSEQLHFHAGYFPDTARELPEQAYALVHLDADLYWPTLQALKYFYPRLSAGGVLIVHDYNHIWPGVRQALQEFSPSISETLIEIPDRQGSVMILRNQPVPRV